jgi:hypothetical protein
LLSSDFIKSLDNNGFEKPELASAKIEDIS